MLSGVLLFLILSPAPLPGQAETPVPGQRVRLHLRGTTPTPVTGRLVHLGADSLRVRTEAGDAVHPLDAVERLDVSAGRASRLPGTIVGGLVGGLAGFWIGSATERAGSDRCYGFCGLGGGAVGFVVGGLAGGTAGYLLLAEEEWEAVPLRSSLGLGPGGLELRIAL